MKIGCINLISPITGISLHIPPVNAKAIARLDNGTELMPSLSIINIESIKISDTIIE